MTLVDDFGRYDARLPILHGQCFALRNDVKLQHTAAFRSELQQNGLIDVYSIEGKEYLQITKWRERTRSDSSHWPDPQHSAAERSEPRPSNAIAISHKPSPSEHQNGAQAADSELWEKLTKQNPGVDIADERRKMENWLLTPKGRGRKLTARFVVNWINKADRTLTRAEPHKSIDTLSAQIAEMKKDYHPDDPAS